MDNMSLIVNGQEFTEIPQSVSFINESFSKGLILKIDGKKYKLLQDFNLVAEQIED